MQFAAWQAVMLVLTRQFENDRPNSCLMCSYLWGFAVVDLACVFPTQRSLFLQIFLEIFFEYHFLRNGVLIP